MASVCYPSCINTVGKEAASMKYYFHARRTLVGVSMRSSATQSQVAPPPPTSVSLRSERSLAGKLSCVVGTKRTHADMPYRLYASQRATVRSLAAKASPGVGYPVADNGDASGTESDEGDEADTEDVGVVEDWVLSAVKDRMKTKQLDPGLYVVATPIGNLEDITLRALRVLQQADGILAEDTRQTAKLLNHFQIKTPLISCHSHNEFSRVNSIISRLRSGERLVVVSDAGMPMVSDPGAILVAAAASAGIPVMPIPGACAVITGIVGAALPSDSFTFVGFLPAKPAKRKQRLQALSSHEP
eukprot:CAMPEP_0118942512 /NCGR_PEP_ID=MMETSP1169-20130426/36327_1 /TAXON_ID=36882 /ORGANISM="Pyramimonas obovata, Strain CCMP722" /LENGTH=300 /DNA_ID=CAMNT_0006887541 /DNA_START=173 /DNA_END=1072 /DNA_ORIENTATION=+